MVERKRQLSLDFTPGLTAQFRTLEDLLANAVHRSRLGVEGVARELDMGASELTRRLNAHVAAKEGDVSNRPLRVADMLGIVKATGDHRPVHWLIETFLEDPDVKRAQAIDLISSMLPMLQSALEASGIAASAPAKGKR